MGEFNLYGVYVPTFLVQMILAYGVFRLVVILTNPLLAKGWVAFPGIFNLCLFIVVLMLVHWIFVLLFGL